MNAPGEGSGRTALITGASAGIGQELAKVFAARGFHLVLTARRVERMLALADQLRREHGILVRVMPGDLARPGFCEHLVHALEQGGTSIDVLVNNAGFAVAGRYRETSWEAQRDCLQVLVTAPAELTHRLLRGMHARGYGRILNVASVAGLMPGSASHTLYGAAKALVIKFSQALHSEQKGTGVHVTALCPGFTLTEFHDVTGTRAAVARLPRMLWLDAAKVAHEGYRAVMKNQAICIPGLQYKVISALAHLLPLKAGHKIAELRAQILDHDD